jgi:hypothetical protein
MEKESLLKHIEEQSLISFTGKINVLKSDNNQHIGVVFLKEGEIIDCSYFGRTGKKGLYALVFEEIGSQEFHKFIIEPEIIKDSQVKFTYSFDDFYQKVQERYELYQKIKRLRPPSYLRLSIDPNFIKPKCQIKIDGFEFDVLSAMVNHKKVPDIYLNCPLYDYEITGALISLRKKKAIRVIGP